MNLSTVLEAAVPLVSCTTTDLLNLEGVLKELTDKKVALYVEAQKMRPDTLYYSLGDIKNKLSDLYAECTVRGTTLIIINPDTPNDIYFDVGQLPTPPSLLYENLSEFMSENDFKEILPALGGLTMKDSIELLMITQAAHGYTNSDTVMRVRLEYYKHTQGLDIVDTELKGYVPDENLSGFANYEKEFFLGDYDYRLRPRGLIIHGIPGTGKSQGAKFLAREWRVPLFRLDSTIQSKWLGQSEANMTQALKTIEMHGPCVLLIDEAEKIFSTGSDNGVSEKLLATLLWWMQEHRSEVFTYMTCNDLKRLPKELQRAGRVDKTLEFKALDCKGATTLGAKVLDSFDNAPVRVHFKGNDTLTGAEVYNKVINAIKDGIKINRVQKKRKKK